MDLYNTPSCEDCTYCELIAIDLGFCALRQVYVSLDATICLDAEVYDESEKPKEKEEETEEVEEEPQIRQDKTFIYPNFGDG